MHSRPHRTAAILLLAALLGLAHLQATLAAVGVVWRAMVLSWDSPTTQLVEEIASGVAPLTDPARHLGDRLVAAARSGIRSPLVDQPTVRRNPAVDCGVTRAPPTA